MKIKAHVATRITSQGMLPLFYHDSFDISINIIRALSKAEITVVEYTNRGKAALSNFRKIKETLQAELPDFCLGIGTVKSLAEAKAFVDAGADFLVSPIVNSQIGEFALENGLLWIPGAMTPTEVYSAQQYVAPIIKIFPANIVGPAFISSICELFPGQLFLPTGGIDLTRESMSLWFDCGACAIGMGSRLINERTCQEREYDQLTEKTQKVLTIIKDLRT